MTWRITDVKIFQSSPDAERENSVLPPPVKTRARRRSFGFACPIQDVTVPTTRSTTRKRNDAYFQTSALLMMEKEETVEEDRSVSIGALEVVSSISIAFP